MRFASADDADAFAQRPCRSVRMVGRCDVCGCVASCTRPGLWRVTRDLVGGADVVAVPDGWPTGDPCGHRATRWTQVVRVSGAADPCGAGCRDATGSVCGCSCGGTNHASAHHLRSIPS